MCQNNARKFITRKKSSFGSNEITKIFANTFNWYAQNDMVSIFPSFFWRICNGNDYLNSNWDFYRLCVNKFSFELSSKYLFTSKI